SRRDNALLDGERRVDCLDRASRSQAVPRHSLGRRYRDALGLLAENGFDRGTLDRVVDLCRRSVCVDVVDLVEGNVSLLERHLDATRGPIPFAGWRGNMIGIAGQAIAGQLGIDFRTAPLRMFQLLDHEDGGTFAHDEAIAIAIEGT